MPGRLGMKVQAAKSFLSPRRLPSRPGAPRQCRTTNWRRRRGHVFVVPGLPLCTSVIGRRLLNRAGLLPHLAATPQDEDGARITLLFSVAPLLASVGNRLQELDQPEL